MGTDLEFDRTLGGLSACDRPAAPPLTEAAEVPPAEDMRRRADRATVPAAATRGFPARRGETPPTKILSLVSYASCRRAEIWN
jgi:hypothetical protein